MSRIFISHSSRNDFAAIALRDWIIAGGWDDHPFLDLDPERGIAAGERWERALHEAADRCEVVLFLVSREWLRSEWCLKEFNLAQKLNKRLFGVLIDDLSLADIPATLTTTWQVVNLASGSDHDLFRVKLPDLSREGHITFSRSGLVRLKAGLDKAGLDPRFFVWPPENDPNRSPYPGLRPLETEDAGIFFGREAPTVVVLDRLRGLREAAPPRLLVILGASGAGKSSFLRAGLIPRLRRDDAHFLPLPIVRPQMAAISGATGLIRAIEEAFKQHGQAINRAEIAAAINDGAYRLLPLLSTLAQSTSVPDISEKAQISPPAVVLSIDQGEELFLSEGTKEGQDFLSLLKDLAIASEPNLIILFTMRSESYEHLQTAEALEGIRQETFPLPTMPHGAFQTIIEGPAQRLQVGKRALKLDPAMTAQVLSDIEGGAGKDALPLLAFTLERLYREYGADGDISAEEYELLGGIGGSIRAAVDGALNAADDDPSIPKDPSERMALLRRALIPALVAIDPETRSPRRRVARISEIPQEARALINCLVEARLLATDQLQEEGKSETIVEPAHEALLRQWETLKGWLKEDTAALLMLGGVQQAARDWSARPYSESQDWLIHTARRLEDAERLREREDFARFITPVEQAYLQACRVQEDERRNRELEEARKLAEAQKQIVQRTRLGLIATSVLCLAAAVFAAFGFHQAVRANNERVNAEQQAVKTEQRSAMLASNTASLLTAEGELDSALLLMLDAAHWFDDASAPDEMRISFTKALEKKARIEVNTLFPNMKVFETDAALLLVNPETNDIFKLTDSLSPPRLVEGSAGDSPILTMRQTGERDEVIVLRKNLEVERVDLVTGERHKVGIFPQPKVKPGRVYEEIPRITPDPEETCEIGCEANNVACITDSGLIVRELTYSELDEKAGGYKAYNQIMDPWTGRIVEGELHFDILSYEDVDYKRGTNGSIYLFDRGKVFSLKPAGDSIVLEEAGIDEIKFAKSLYGSSSCELEEGDPLIELVKEEDHSGAKRICRIVGDKVLLTAFYHTSFLERRDTLLSGFGDAVDVRKVLSEAAGKLSEENVHWAGINPENYRIAVLLDRDAIVVDNDYLLLNYRHPTRPHHARFAGADRLIVVEDESGRLVAHDLADIPRKEETLFTMTTSTIIGSKNKQVTTMHHGNCVGSETLRSDYDIMPDGRKILYKTNGMTAEGYSNEVQVLGGRTPVILNLDGFRKDDGCVQISDDWKEILIEGTAGVGVFDFDRVLATASLKQAEIGVIPAFNLSSVFFANSSKDIVTSDRSTRVILWKREKGGKEWRRRIVYRGKNPIFYAEPDANGDLLIILEHSAARGTIRGLLYSVRSRQEWFHLGSESKWLGATFSNKREIIVSDGGDLDVFRVLQLSTLVELANKELSPLCRPTTEGDYKSSPCWPSTGFPQK